MNAWKPDGCPEEVEDCPRSGEHEEYNRRKWSLDRTINVPTILSILGACVFIIGFFVIQDRRMSNEEFENKVQAKDILDLKLVLKENGQKLDRMDGNQMVVMATQQEMVKTLDKIDRRR